VSVHSDTFYYAVCDVCEERVALCDEVGFTVDVSAQALREYITDCDGLIAEDGTVTCPACVYEQRMGDAA
jgi:hypothetical protein